LGQLVSSLAVDCDSAIRFIWGRALKGMVLAIMLVPKSKLFFCSSDRPFGCRKRSPDWIIVLSIMLAPKSISLFCSSSRAVGWRMSPDCIVVLAMLALNIFFCCCSVMDVSTVGGGCTTVLDFTDWKSCGPAPDRLTARGGEP
jgi:hypothetical protein